jgi:hypothetical protein
MPTRRKPFPFNMGQQYFHCLHIMVERLPMPNIEGGILFIERN